MGSAGPLAEDPSVIQINEQGTILELVVVNPHPQKRWLGLGPMDGAELALERQGQILAQRGDRVTYLTDRRLWSSYRT